MKWYRPIACDHTVKNPLVCEASNFDKYDNWGMGPYRVENYFFRGTVIENWPEDVYVTTLKEKNDGDPDDVLQNKDMIPIFSKRLVEAIQASNIDGFQFLPITVLNYKQESVGEFFIANCTIMFDAFDYEKSTYWRFPADFPNPEARGLVNCSKFVLHKELLDGHDVFRMEGQRRAYFVSEKFVKLFKKGHFTGYSFKQVELS